MHFYRDVRFTSNGMTDEKGCVELGLLIPTTSSPNIDVTSL